MADYQVAYPEPLELREGERVRLGQPDEQWPEFVWAILKKRAGWVPMSYLRLEGRRAVALRDYTARELGARVGEELELHDEVGGWWWASNQAGESGWFPAQHLSYVDEPPS